MDAKEIQGLIFQWISENFGRSEAEQPSYDIGALAKHLADKFDKETVVLFQHKTSGGAVYLTDDHKFADASVMIRLDGGAELMRCDVKELK